MGIKALVTAIGLVMVVLVAGCATQSQDSSSTDNSSASTQYPNADVYKGSFPCRSCSGINITLALKGDNQTTSNGDRTFVIDAIYGGDSSNSSNQHFTGNWTIRKGIPIDSQAEVIVLTPDQKDGHTYYFLRHGSSQLELISPQLYPFENGSVLRLNKQ